MSRIRARKQKRGTGESAAATTGGVERKPRSRVHEAGHREVHSSEAGNAREQSGAVKGTKAREATHRRVWRRRRSSQCSVRGADAASARNKRASISEKASRRNGGMQRTRQREHSAKATAVQEQESRRCDQHRRAQPGIAVMTRARDSQSTASLQERTAEPAPPLLLAGGSWCVSRPHSTRRCGCAMTEQ